MTRRRRRSFTWDGGTVNYWLYAWTWAVKEAVVRGGIWVSASTGHPFVRRPDYVWMRCAHVDRHRAFGLDGLEFLT